MHLNLEKIRINSYKNNNFYDYGNGYYYQSMDIINISGYRDTNLRIRKLCLEERLKNKSVLDIGSNTGFLILSLSKVIKNGLGVELNPSLVLTAKEVAKYMKVTNIDFIVEAFENFENKINSFDVVLSLANNNTYDGNTKQSEMDYFKKVSNILKKNGELIFESHPPQIEPPDKLDKTISAIQKYFTIKEKPDINMRNFLDRNRTYIIAEKK